MLQEFREQHLTWDKANRRIHESVKANASDSKGRKLTVQVLNDGVVEDLTGTSLSLFWKTRNEKNKGLDAFDVVDATQGIFELYYTTGMLSNEGKLRANLVLVDDLGKIVSDAFVIEVSPGIDEGAVESSDSFTALTKALVDVQNLEQNYAPRLNEVAAQLAQTKKDIDGREYNAMSPPSPLVAAEGDGETFDSDAINSLLNYMENNGGGKLKLPVGHYILDKTILVPSNCMIEGVGKGTVLTGYRPDGVKGHALISNKGILGSTGYDGTSDFSIMNLTIDSPDTNGIAIGHAKNVYIANIYGVSAYAHHVDISGSKNVFCENLFLGNSGTAPFQIDCMVAAQTIWDGERPHTPIYDGTAPEFVAVDNIVVESEVYDPDNFGIHFHKEGNGKDIYIRNAKIVNFRTGIYLDPDLSWENINFENLKVIHSRNAVWYRPSAAEGQKRVSFKNVVIEDCTYIPMQLSNCDGVVIEDLQANIVPNADSGIGVDLIDCKNVILRGIKVVGQENNRIVRGVFIRGSDTTNIKIDGLDVEHASGEGVLVADSGNGASNIRLENLNLKGMRRPIFFDRLSGSARRKHIFIDKVVCDNVSWCGVLIEHSHFVHIGEVTVIVKREEDQSSDSQGLNISDCEFVQVDSLIVKSADSNKINRGVLVRNTTKALHLNSGIIADCSVALGINSTSENEVSYSGLRTINCDTLHSGGATVSALNS